MGRVLGRSGNCSERTCGRPHVILPTPQQAPQGYTRTTAASLCRPTPLSGSGEHVKEFPVPAAELPIRGQRLCYYPARQFGRLFLRRVALCRHRSLRDRRSSRSNFRQLPGIVTLPPDHTRRGAGRSAAFPVFFRSSFAIATNPGRSVPAGRLASAGPTGRAG